MARTPWYRQLDAMDCGPTCVRMIAKYHGHPVPASELRARTQLRREGISMAELSRLAEAIGFRTMALRVHVDLLAQRLPLPCVAHWDQRHFVVLYRVHADGRVVVADPGAGVHTFERAEFLRHWSSADAPGQGLVLLFEPTPALAERELDRGTHATSHLALLGSYLARHRGYLFQVVIGLLVGSLMSLVLPFLTQSLVDHGVTSRDLDFVHMVLAAQLMLFLGRTTIDFIRGWLVLHVGARINIALVADFLVHLMRLPMQFFDARAPGDILQRVDDHRRVEQFLTSTLLDVAISVVLLGVLGVVLLVYSGRIFGVFVLGSLAAAGWTLLFMRRRRVLDQQAFVQRAASQNTLMQLVGGMAEIKLAASEIERRWDWERIQARLFRVTERRLGIAQLQQAGNLGLLELKNIVITFFAANEVIAGEMTLGMMLAVSYVLGQANRPIEQLLRAIDTVQDTRVGLERIAEIRAAPPEIDARAGGSPPTDGAVVVEGVSFAYPGGPPVLRDISFTIPHGRTTAIVGASGSGKTTLLKLLLRFVDPQAGTIRIDGVPLPAIDVAAWRRSCGVVLQDGFVFSDTIARNICSTEADIDVERMHAAARIARIDEFVRRLPRGFHTTIGLEGVGLSQGQRQRLLIARAIYKDPRVLLLDEATSALDASNERAIVDALAEFLVGRTSVIVAHRLSTVRNADHIVVLEEGRVAECGTHDELVARRGVYFALVSNQLELGH